MFSFAHTLSNRRHSSLTRAGAACAGRAPSPPRRVELLPQSYGSSRPALFKSAGTMTACSQSPKATPHRIQTGTSDLRTAYGSRLRSRSAGPVRPHDLKRAVERFGKRLKVRRTPIGAQRFVAQSFRSSRVALKYRCSPGCRSLHASLDLIVFLLRRGGGRCVPARRKWGRNI